MEAIEKLYTRLDKLKEAKRLIEDDIFICESDIIECKKTIIEAHRKYIGKSAFVETMLGSRTVAICSEVKINQLLQIRYFFELKSGKKISVNSFVWI